MNGGEAWSVRWATQESATLNCDSARQNPAAGKTYLKYNARWPPELGGAGGSDVVCESGTVVVTVDALMVVAEFHELQMSYGSDAVGKLSGKVICSLK